MTAAVLSTDKSSSKKSTDVDRQRQRQRFARCTALSVFLFITASLSFADSYGAAFVAPIVASQRRRPVTRTSRADAVRHGTKLQSTVGGGNAGSRIVTGIESNDPIDSRFAFFRRGQQIKKKNFGRVAHDGLSNDASLVSSTSATRRQASQTSTLPMPTRPTTAAAHRNTGAVPTTNAVDPLWCAKTKVLGTYKSMQQHQEAATASDGKGFQTNAALRKIASGNSLPTASSRRSMLQSLAAIALVTNPHQNKQYNLNNEQLARIIVQDVVERQSLVTADMTRSIYDEHAKFKDGSDLDGWYFREQWIRGCRMLFRASHCHSRMVPNTLVVTDEMVTFRFEEDLTFRGPFSPQCFLSGAVVMKRCPTTGLIQSYEEKWDKDVSSIVKSAKLQAGFLSNFIRSKAANAGTQLNS